MAGVKFTVDLQKFKKDMKQLDRRIRFAGKGTEHALAIQMAKDTEPYVPASGAPSGLYNRVIVHEDTIIYPGPYARFLYYGKLMIDPDTGSAWAPKGATKVIDPGGRNLDIKKNHHSKAQAHWFEASKAQNLEKWKRVAGRVMKREFGG